MLKQQSSHTIATIDGSETWTRTNPCLQGPYEPLYNESEVRSLHVVGEVPQELDGALYRTGGNQQFKPLDPDHYHWFDGDGMVHAFRLRDGKVSYCNKWVETDGLKVERRFGRALYNGIYGSSGQPQKDLPQGAPVIKTVAGINVVPLAGRVLTMHEADPFYWEIDPYSLETLGKYDFGGQFNSMLTAHPHYDHRTNEFLFYGLDNEQNFVECVSATMDGQVTSRHRVSLPIAPFVHDFVFSENCYIFVFGPLRWRPYAADTVQAGESSLSFDSGSPGRVLLIKRKTGEALWLETKSCMVVRYLNAYEVGDTIVVDASAFETLRPDAKVRVPEFFPRPLGDGPLPFSEVQLRRFTIDLAAGQASHERIGDFAAEFVMRNDRVMGRKHRYGYMAATHNPGKDTKDFNSLAKHDYETGRTSFQHLNDGYELTPGEPIFVPREGTRDEDDGWIMAVWYDPQHNCSELIILAAKDFDGEPVARIKLDHRVPLGFHGGWIPRSAHERHIPQRLR